MRRIRSSGRHDNKGKAMIHDDPRKLTDRQLRSALETLNSSELRSIEIRVRDLFSEGIALAERRAPGHLADRLIALGDLYPMLVSDIPAHMTGGKDLLDLAAEDDDSSIANIVVIWKKVREDFRAQLRHYFSRIAAGEKGNFQRCRRHARIVHLASRLRFLFRAARQDTQACAQLT
jgi:hypothetical protein